MPQSLNDVLATLGDPRVLVVGDVMLDRDRHVSADRVDAESAAVITREQQIQESPGGAALVVEALWAFGAHPSVVAVIGDDDEGRMLQQHLSVRDVEPLLITDASRPTTLKERILSFPQESAPRQMLRIDRESTCAVSGDVLDQVREGVVSRMSGCDAVVIADYGKGVCTPELVEFVIETAAQHSRPVVVDPARTAGFRHYRGCTVLTPNRMEASDILGQELQTPAQALRVGQQLCNELFIEAVAITLDRDGLAVVTRDGQSLVLPAQARSVVGTRGAGDVVTAMLAIGLGEGMELFSACQMANLAAGMLVEQQGSRMIDRRDMRERLVLAEAGCPEKLTDIRRLKQDLDQRRRCGERIVLTNGCFDVLHAGHVACLQQAAAEGDCLIVAVNSDQSIRRLKGPHRPVYSEGERLQMLAALAVVDYLIVFDETTPHRILEELRPDLLVKGGDYRPEGIMGRDVVESYGGQVKIMDHVRGLSTSENLKRVVQLAERHSVRTDAQRIPEAG